ncbi:MAG: hypothetical protein A4S17_02340 [Proteobacteria bacterium HN_bin10]|jgi:hypothetical protein|nr:MAG: hypothetical protein A4S17_02340 [Proteobacteria bacterium HN_bin10]
MIERVFAGVMIVSGLLTLTMLYTAIAPSAAMQSFFGEGVESRAVSIVVANWGILIGLMGALLIYGALHPPSRKLALVVAGASKIAFVGLILSQGQLFLDGLGAAVIIDSAMVVLFAAYLFFGRPTA